MMSYQRRAPAAAAVLALAALGVTGACGGEAPADTTAGPAAVAPGAGAGGNPAPGAGQEASAPGTSLTDLDDVGALKARFNSDAGTPRLLLLLSPT